MIVCTDVLVKSCALDVCLCLQRPCTKAFVKDQLGHRKPYQPHISNATGAAESTLLFEKRLLDHQIQQGNTVLTLGSRAGPRLSFRSEALEKIVWLLGISPSYGFKTRVLLSCCKDLCMPGEYWRDEPVACMGDTLGFLLACSSRPHCGPLTGRW